MNRYCQVNNCRYIYSHTTLGHKCGNCKNYGHGQNECNNKKLIDELRQYYSDTMPIAERCTAKTCNYRTTHSIEAHFCLKCGNNHSTDTCEFNSQMPQVCISQVRKKMGNIRGKIYVKEWAGMGNWSFYRRDDLGKLVLQLTIDYNKVNDPEVLNFISGYTFIK